MEEQWNHKIFGVHGTGFAALALEIFALQYRENPLYRAFCQARSITPDAVREIEDIPFLPIRFFKTHQVATGSFVPDTRFESSGTTGEQPSVHLVKDVSLYEESFRNGFKKAYGPVNEWCILALLPSYLERQHSSLVYMVEQLMKQSAHPENGFFLYEHAALAERLVQQEAQLKKTLLIGVTYALLDFAEGFPMPLKNTVVMETGGMKGRKVEMIRAEVHQLLKDAFTQDQIHSEYGMTELLSQAYSAGNGIFRCPPWMQVRIRDEEDPFTILKKGSGVINIIDLANVHSCSFIATDDVGRLYADGSFEVLGRMDGSDLRGCGLMVVSS